MKTFDIATEYLKDVDFSKHDTYKDNTPKEEKDKVMQQYAKYLADERNTRSNEYYRGMTFEACYRHHIDLAQGRASYWNVACEIIESEKSILDGNYEKWNNTNYPKVMVDKFINYCDSLNPQPNFLNSESEVRHEFFMIAYHYILDAES